MKAESNVAAETSPITKGESDTVESAAEVEGEPKPENGDFPTGAKRKADSQSTRSATDTPSGKRKKPTQIPLSQFWIADPLPYRLGRAKSPSSDGGKSQKE